MASLSCLSAFGNTSAATIAQALGGRRSGRGWIAKCPAHADRTPSLAICESDDRKVLFKCWGRCTQDEVITALVELGLWRRGRRLSYPSLLSDAARPHAARPRANVRPLHDPLEPWRAASPVIAGTAVERYLTSRGLSLPRDPSALRFAPQLLHWPSQARWPAMVALVQRADSLPLTVHQTFLAPDGRGKAPVEKPRLFAPGASPAGGAVWFGRAAPDQEFIVAEGIELTLSAMALYDAAAGSAALSTHGLKTLVLPPAATQVRVFCDHDPKGQGLAAAREAYRRWRAEGREVAVCMAKRTGQDANDVLIARRAQR